jgi:hypothetical protein
LKPNFLKKCKFKLYSNIRFIQSFFFFLISVPTGKPVTTIAHNTSSSSIYISWKSPPPDTIFGEFLGYRITFRSRDKNPENVKEIYIRDSTVEVNMQ